jgi:endonuclease YncB( thermonuclease family)
MRVKQMLCIVIAVMMLTACEQVENIETGGAAARVFNVRSVETGGVFRGDISGVTSRGFRIRLKGIETHSIEDRSFLFVRLSDHRRGIEAKEFLKSALQNGKTIELRDAEISARVIIDGADIGAGLIKAGLARVKE